jgi:hypothetical protein
MNQLNLFTNKSELESIPKPDLRIAFQSHPSWNDFSGEYWSYANQIKKWQSEGQTAFCETAQKLGVKLEPYKETENYVYRGKAKTKQTSGLRLKENFFFQEQVVLIVRMWTSTHRTYDIDNVCIKHTLDGMIAGRLMPDDNTDYIKGVFRLYHSVDASLKLTSRELLERKQTLSNAIKSAKRDSPKDKRFWFDFWKIENYEKNVAEIMKLDFTK